MNRPPANTDARTWVIIPALNEEEGLRLVLSEIPDAVAGVIVVDNGSDDDTPSVAKKMGARLVRESRRGYGSACLAGMRALPAEAGIVAFVDADYSDHAAELVDVIAPILHGESDLVIGSRVRGDAEPGALLPQARFGNWLATRMIRVLYGFRFTDLGPMRAIRREALDGLGMRDPTFGWTVEMQVRALKSGLRCSEVPVSYRKRRGRSKISGTVKGTILAGWKIITTILRLRVTG